MLYHILSYETSSLLKIDNIGFSEDVQTCRFGPGRRDLFLIHYVFAGAGFFNGQLLRAGEGFLITPNAYEDYAPLLGEPWKLLWVTSRDPHMAELFEEYEADPKTHIFSYDHVTAVEDLTNMIRKNHNTVYTASLILEIFLNLFNRKKRKKSEGGMADIYYHHAIHYMELNIFRPVRIAELTAALGISQPYLFKIFQEKCGRSPKEKLDELKIKRAKELLAHGNTVCDVAYSLGFGSPQDFSKFFKHKTGYPPSRMP